jgi:hypothetical protein
VQWSDVDFIGDQSGVEIFQIGANLQIPLGDMTRVLFAGAYRTENSPDPQDSERWLARLTLYRQLGLRTSLSIYYQYEDLTRIGGNLEEHLWMLTLRRYF